MAALRPMSDWLSTAGTTINCDRKLLIVEAGTSFGIETENHLKVELSFVSDFRGFVYESSLDRSIAFRLHVAFLLSHSENVSVVAL